MRSSVRALNRVATVIDALSLRRFAAVRRVHGQRGQTLIEFALAAGMFFLLTIGTVELGVVVWQYNFVTSLAMEGARWASVHGKTSAEPASAADVQAYVNSRALGRTVTVTATPVPSTTGSGETVTVVVAESMTPSSSFIPFTFQLTGTATLVVSR